MPRMEITELALELTEACNYRCVMCDYWKLKKPSFLTVEMVARFLKLVSMENLYSVLITGGEPLLNKNWREIALLFPPRTKRYLCTNGSPLKAANSDVGNYFDRITVSVDGATVETFAEIRGRNDLEHILRALNDIKRRTPGTTLFLKMTIQRLNVHEVAELFEFALKLGYIDGVRFGVPDMSQGAFAMAATGRDFGEYSQTVLLTESDIASLESQALYLYGKYPSQISQGFLAEGNLFRYVERFRGMLGQGPKPVPPRDCEIPFRTMFLKANGGIGGCFFLGDMSNLAQLENPETWNRYIRSVEEHNPLLHPICRNCDQCMIPSGAPQLGGN